MKKYFTTGLIAIIPLAVVGWVVQLVYGFISTLSGRFSFYTLVMGFVIGILGIFAIGALLIHSRLIRGIREWIEQQIIDKTPLAKTIYKFSKDIAENALDEKVYDKVVRAYPFGRENTGMIGFLTSEKHKTCFIPSSPNPLSGQTYIGCEYDVLDGWTYDDVIKYGISVGMSLK